MPTSISRAMLRWTTSGLCLGMLIPCALIVSLSAPGTRYASASVASQFPASTPAPTESLSSQSTRIPSTGSGQPGTLVTTAGSISPSRTIAPLTWLFIGAGILGIVLIIIIIARWIWRL